MVPLRASIAVVVLLASPSLLVAQAPRESAEADLGGVQVSVEYGSPRWSEERRAQMERMVPIGGAWRLGADTRTTLVVKGGAVAFGDAVIEEGGYGLNLRRTAEKQWAFLVYDGSDTNVAPEDQAWEVPALLLDEAGAEPAAQLVVAFEEAGGRKVVAVRWGTLALQATIAAIETREAELVLGGEQLTARWFVRAAGAAPKPGAWFRVGSLGSFYVDDVDCAMDVQLRLDGGKARVRFVNRARARLADRLARVESDLAQATGGAGTKGTASARFNADVKRFEAAKAALEQEIADLGAVPPPLELPVVLQPAKEPSGLVAVEIQRRDAGLFVVVEAVDKSGEAAIDEAKLLPAPVPDGK